MSLRSPNEHEVFDDAFFQSGEGWEQAFDTLPDLITILDRGFRIVRANKAVTDRLRLPKKEILGRTCYSLIHRTDEPPPFCPHSLLLQDGKHHWVEIFENRLDGDFLVKVSPLRNAQGRLVGCVHFARDIADKKELEEVQEKLKTLTGLLPICSSCKKIRDDKGYWNHVEAFIRKHSEASFSHGICPECMRKLYPDFAEKIYPKTDSDD